MLIFAITEMYRNLLKIKFQQQPSQYVFQNYEMDRRQSVWNTLNIETAKLHASNLDLTQDTQKSSRKKRQTTVSD